MRGMTVTLFAEEIIGYDEIGEPLVHQKPITVEDVLIGEPSTDEITESVNLYGKRISFMLGIPKKDANDWTNKDVQWTDAYGRTINARTFGYPITGVAANIPGKWHMKVRCEQTNV